MHFSQNGKKANLVPVHKKGDKQSFKNYRPISLLPICGKIFARLFEYFIENDLNSHNQSGFKPEDSNINQLLSIKHEIFKSFGESYKTRSVFFDMPKAFDKVWHEYLPYELKENGISGKLLNTVKDFFYQQKQRVVLNLSDDLASDAKLFVDDTSLFSLVENMAKSANELNNDLTKISTWVFEWKIKFNPDPTKQTQEVIFGRKLQNVNQQCLIFSHNTVRNILE